MACATFKKSLWKSSDKRINISEQLMHLGAQSGRLIDADCLINTRTLQND